MVYKYGEKILLKCKQVGVDGLIIVDLPCLKIKVLQNV